MDVVLHNDLILIRTDLKTLRTAWMSDFLALHFDSMLLMPKAVLVFNNSAYTVQKRTFIEALSKTYAKTHEFSYEFYVRSMLRYRAKPIKIELYPQEVIQPVTVELFAHNSQSVEISLYVPNPWIMGYLQSQLGLYIREANAFSLFIDVASMQAKTRLERTLNKRDILHYRIEYRFDEHFVSRLYGEFGGFDFSEEAQEHFDALMHYYTVLQCPIGAPQDTLKRSYKKLLRLYHPDKVHCESREMIHRYTQKFQMLQEAYTALVS